MAFVRMQNGISENNEWNLIAYDFKIPPGINSRLDEMQACYLRAFLPKLGEWNRRRAALAHRYDEALRGIPGIRLVRRTAASVHHLYVIRASRRAALRPGQHRAPLGDFFNTSLAIANIDDPHPVADHHRKGGTIS